MEDSNQPGSPAGELCVMFRGNVNPTTGRLEWVQQDRDVTSEESDLSPELAR